MCCNRKCNCIITSYVTLTTSLYAYSYDTSSNYFICCLMWCLLRWLLLLVLLGCWMVRRVVTVFEWRTVSGDDCGQNDFLKQRLQPVFRNLEWSHQRKFCRRGTSQAMLFSTRACGTSGCFVAASRHVHALIQLYLRYTCRCTRLHGGMVIVAAAPFPAHTFTCIAPRIRTAVACTSLLYQHGYRRLQK